ncbi:MAG: cell division topological specificity factor MinE [Syntrophomonadaceae bacterium]|nr:cell division topological specificity factor MinE [Syntrophomonadaceae bacterium]
MAFLDLINKLLGRDNSSKQVAKERLRLVLVHDRANTAPVDFLTALKEDLIRVISQYMEIDEEALEVTFSNSDNSVALIANIPVIKMRRAVNN